MGSRGTLRSLVTLFRRLTLMSSRMNMDLGTFLLQWSAGGLLFCWVTTRGRLVSLGYGWLLRIVYSVFALLAAVVWSRQELTTTRGAAIVGAVLTAGSAIYGIGSSVVRRRAGVSGRHELNAARKQRVAEMVGNNPTTQEGKSEIPDGITVTDARLQSGSSDLSDSPGDGAPREFPPILDLLAATIGFAALFVATPLSGGNYGVSALRLVIGAALMGSVSDAMLLGHWYLTQPGLPRTPLKELVKWTAMVTPFAIASWLIPTGIQSVFTGEINDGFSGLLGWVWAVCGGSTLLLLGATWLALKERFYSAVMAATGLLYLAILTAFGIDLVARAVLAP